MSVASIRFATHARTWLLIAALTALLIGIGALLGGAFLYLFAGLAAAINVIGYWFSDRLALNAGRAQPVVAGTMPELERWCRPGTARSSARATAVHDPVGAAERVRHRAQAAAALMEASNGVPDPADLPRLIDRLEHALSVVEAAGSPAGPMLRRAISAAYQLRSGQPNTVRTLAARLLRLQQWAAEQDLRGFD